MRFRNRLHDQPLKRNDSLNHNRDLTISIGGTGPLAFGHSLRYLTNRFRLVTTRKTKRAVGHINYFAADKILSTLLLVAFMTKAIALPKAAEISFAGSIKSVCINLKKAFDLFGSIFGLILLMPLFLIIAVLIKLDSRGPVFYAQERVGLNRRKRDRRAAECMAGEERRGRDRRRKNCYGKPFKVYKFRTMIDNAEKKCGPAWAIKNDPRITRVGAFLRKTRLDELPQLINVFKGEMSLIGPRPERPVFIEDLSKKVENYTLRLQVKPGITGLAQVENGYDSSIDSVKDKVAYDLRYINRWSLWQDIKILMKTVIVVITGKGAF